MAWQRGPLPNNTWGWGGIVLKGGDSGGGFYFADFRGNHVLIVPDNIRVDAADVDWYDNSLTLPPVEGVKGRVGSSTPKEGD
jgi:hypothetical protein